MSARRILAAVGGFAVLCAIGLVLAAPAEAKEKEAKAKTISIVVRAGKPDNPNYALARQFAAALALGGKGAFALDVKESQGSVQNVIDAPKSRADTIFTTSPSLIRAARRGAKPFKKNPGYYDIRALFPIPFQTMQWIVRRDSRIESLKDLAGHSFVPGNKFSLSERLTAAALQALGIEKKVQLIDIDVAAAPAAIMRNAVSGLAVVGSFPVPMVDTIAKAIPIRLLGLDPPALDKVLASDDNVVRQVIPKGTYPGVDENVTTIAVPAGAYTTVRMSNTVAYALTKAFWSQRAALAKRDPAWKAVTDAALPALGIRLHPGALRYYEEADIAIPKALR